MTAGDLRYIADFYERQATDDGAGGQVEQWVPIYQCWAACDPQGIPERYEAAQMSQQATYRISIRPPDKPITHQHRVGIQQIFPDLLDIRYVQWGLVFWTIQAEEIARGL